MSDRERLGRVVFDVMGHVERWDPGTADRYWEGLPTAVRAAWSAAAEAVRRAVLAELAADVVALIDEHAWLAGHAKRVGLISAEERDQGEARSDRIRDRLRAALDGEG